MGYNTDSQCSIIANYLNEGRKITALQALDLCGCFRLSARIADLKERGYDIASEMIDVDGKRVAQYSLNQNEKKD